MSGRIERRSDYPATGLNRGFWDTRPESFGDISWCAIWNREPARTTACDCERASDPGLTQKLFLMADDTLLNKIKTPNNRLKQLLAKHKKMTRRSTNCFWPYLSRLPTDKERENFTAYREGHKDRRAAFGDALWALVNTNEFILNH